MASPYKDFQQQDWGNKRCSSRNAVSIPAELMIPAGPRFKVAVMDLSTTGFRLETPNYIDVGRRIYLTIPSFHCMQARIAWNHRDWYGCEFAQALHPSIFAHIAEKHPSLVQ